MGTINRKKPSGKASARRIEEHQDAKERECVVRCWTKTTQETRLGSERYSIVQLPDVEGLDANWVTRIERFAGPSVVQHKCVHAAQARQHSQPFAAIERQKDFGIGPGSKRVSLQAQLVAQFPKVEDLAVVSDPHGTRLVGHRLRACCAQIENRQASVAEAHAAGAQELGPLAVRPPMREPRR